MPGFTPFWGKVFIVGENKKKSEEKNRNSGSIVIYFILRYTHRMSKDVSSMVNLDEEHNVALLVNPFTNTL